MNWCSVKIQLPLNFQRKLKTNLNGIKHNRTVSINSITFYFYWSWMFFNLQKMEIPQSWKNNIFKRKLFFLQFLKKILKIKTNKSWWKDKAKQRKKGKKSDGLLIREKMSPKSSLDLNENFFFTFSQTKDKRQKIRREGHERQSIIQLKP